MKISEKLGAQPIKPLVFISSISIYFVFVNWSYFNIHSLVFLNKQSVWLILLVPFVFLGAAVFSKSKSAFLDALHSIMAVFYATLPFCLLHNMAFTHEINNLQRTEFNLGLFWPFPHFEQRVRIWAEVFWENKIN